MYRFNEVMLFNICCCKKIVYWFFYKNIGFFIKIIFENKLIKFNESFIIKYVYFIMN